MVTVAFGYTTAEPWRFEFGVLGFEFCVAALAVNAERRWAAEDAKWGEVAQKDTKTDPEKSRTEATVATKEVLAV